MSNRFCTKYFKIFPIDRYLSDKGACELLIGFNADEEPGKDRTGNFMKCKNVDYKYPLWQAGITREDCEEILAENGLAIDWPFYMNRDGCYLCFFKKTPELKAMYFFNRAQFDKVMNLEKAIQDKRARNYTAMLGTGKTLQQIADECNQELSLWGRDQVEAMYMKVKGAVSCGAFCHR